jgi:hypothetical protein
MMRGMTTFTITLRTREGGDSIRTLRAALKILLRRFGLRTIKVERAGDDRLRQGRVDR